MRSMMRNYCKYYYKRAEAKLEMAQKSEVAEAVKARYMLAGYYLDHVFSEEVGHHSDLRQLFPGAKPAED
jgi:hypothetical protein